MKYMGSKNRIAKPIVDYLNSIRESENQWYIEPFVGGANVIDKMKGRRLGVDAHKELISMWTALQFGWLPPSLVTEELYQECKNGMHDSHLRGYVGFNLSFGAKWFGGYRRDKAGTKGCPENMATQSRRAYNSIFNQLKGLSGVKFLQSKYEELPPFSNCLVYCDPPYEGTTKYATSKNFDHDHFWDWVRKESEFNDVVVSEYNAPDDFECVLDISLTNGLNNTKASEKLFRYKKYLS